MQEHKGSPPSDHRPWQNRLLAALAYPERERLAPHLQLVPMRLGDLIYQPEMRLHYAYFPTTAVMSLHYVMRSGASSETAGVGNEGMVGIPFIMGAETASNSAVVQRAGHAYRMEGRLLAREFERAAPLRRVLLRYVQALMRQTSQTAICNRHHSLEQQLSRWLLLTLDRDAARELVVTQQQISCILGVRREGVTETAGKFQDLGFIRYRRGHITVLNRRGLEAHACECYSVVRQELDRLRSEYSHHESLEIDVGQRRSQVAGQPV